MIILYKMKKAAKICLTNPKKELLLYLRDDKLTIPYPGYWDFIGGEIEKGETPLQSLQREINEEIPACGIKDIQELGNFFYRRLYTQIFFFKGNINEDIDYINQKLIEGQEAKYFKFDELFQPKFPQLYKDFIIANKSRIFE